MKQPRSTPEFLEAVMQARAAGKCTREMAEAMDVTMTAVEAAVKLARRHGDPRATSKTRIEHTDLRRAIAARIKAEHAANATTRGCLRCQRGFPSSGPGHRICDNCKGHPDFGGSAMDCTAHARISIEGRRA